MSHINNHYNYFIKKIHIDLQNNMVHNKILSIVTLTLYYYS